MLSLYLFHRVSYHDARIWKTSNHIFLAYISFMLHSSLGDHTRFVFVVVVALFMLYELYGAHSIEHL